VRRVERVFDEVPDVEVVGLADVPHAVVRARVLHVLVRHAGLAHEGRFGGRPRLLFRLQAEELNPTLGLDDFAKLHERWLARTRPWWDAALAAGELDPTLEHNAVATVIIGALRGIALEWLLAPDLVDVDAAYAQLERTRDRSHRVS
jgi:hypothetical protein